MILVANPGTHPEMMRMASALVERNISVKYATASAWAHDSRIMKIANHRWFSGTPIHGQLLRRVLPVKLRSRDVKLHALSSEVVYQFSKAAGHRNAATMLRNRNRRFQSKVSRFVQRSAKLQLVVGQYTASSEIFRSCSPGVVKVLNYPIAHHKWLNSRLESDARMSPHWKALLKGHSFSEEESVVLDEEIQAADYILVPSSYVMRTFIESGVAESKIRVTPLGCEIPSDVEMTRHQVPLAESLDFQRNELHVLFAGQVTQRKGIGYLVEAMQSVKNSHLTIVGFCSPEAKELIASSANISLVPSLPRAELFAYMRNSDVLVLPSLAEGFPLVAIEAMANGVPCLMSKNTFASDVITHKVNGFVLEDISASEIARNLSWFENHRAELVDVGHVARETAKLYSWDQYEIAIGTLLAELVAGR